jgi:hypothetical protein
VISRLFWKIDAVIIWLFKAAIWAVLGLVAAWGVWYAVHNHVPINPATLEALLLGAVLGALVCKK